jgi:hypothetical protein
MLLTREQSFKLLGEHGVYADECCDRCGQLLGAVRFTLKGYPEAAYCSRVCRDGANARAPGTCPGCGGSLAGLRKGTRHCSATCRSREYRVSQTTRDSRCGPRKTQALTSEGRRFGCPYTRTAVNGHFAVHEPGSASD